MDTNKGKSPVVFESISHPILESLDPSDAVSFLVDRERYEVPIAEKRKDDADLMPAMYQS